MLWHIKQPISTIVLWIRFYVLAIGWLQAYVRLLWQDWRQAEGMKTYRCVWQIELSDLYSRTFETESNGTRETSCRKICRIGRIRKKLMNQDR